MKILIFRNNGKMQDLLNLYQQIDDAEFKGQTICMIHVLLLAPQTDITCSHYNLRIEDCVSIPKNDCVQNSIICSTVPADRRAGYRDDCCSFHSQVIS